MTACWNLTLTLTGDPWSPRCSSLLEPDPDRGPLVAPLQPGPRLTAWALSIVMAVAFLAWLVPHAAWSLARPAC